MASVRDIQFGSLNLNEDLGSANQDEAASPSRVLVVSGDASSTRPDTERVEQPSWAPVAVAEDQAAFLSAWQASDPGSDYQSTGPTADVFLPEAITAGFRERQLQAFDQFREASKGLEGELETMREHGWSIRAHTYEIPTVDPETKEPSTLTYIGKLDYVRDPNTALGKLSGAIPSLLWRMIEGGHIPSQNIAADTVPVTSTVRTGVATSTFNRKDVGLQGVKATQESLDEAEKLIKAIQTLSEMKMHVENADDLRQKATDPLDSFVSYFKTQLRAATSADEAQGVAWRSKLTERLFERFPSLGEEIAFYASRNFRLDRSYGDKPSKASGQDGETFGITGLTYVPTENTKLSDLMEPVSSPRSPHWCSMPAGYVQPEETTVTAVATEGAEESNAGGA